MMRIDGVFGAVETVDTEFAMTLGLSTGSVIRVETSFVLAQPGREPVHADPEVADRDLEVYRSMRGRAVIGASFEEFGALTVWFADGAHLYVPSDADFEAWSVNGSDGSLFVAMPGGGVAQWGARA